MAPLTATAKCSALSWIWIDDVVMLSKRITKRVMRRLAAAVVKKHWDIGWCALRAHSSYVSIFSDNKVDSRIAVRP